MNPIAIFYHCLLFRGDPPDLAPVAFQIVNEQMRLLEQSGILGAASEMTVGINGGEESVAVAKLLVPHKARFVMHGLGSKSENLTIVELEKWLPGHENWYVLYFHAKGCTHGAAETLASRTLWRRCMERHLIGNWRQCVADLDLGFEAVGCHWMAPPATPPTQYIFAGNFWFAKASFLRTLPSIMERARIKQSGIGALESRYESEVWIGNGPRPPRVRDYHGPNWNPSKVATCA